MNIIPAFSENKENCLRLYFACKDKSPSEVCDALEKIYACYSRMSVTVRDGEKYICLEITELE